MSAIYSETSTAMRRNYVSNRLPILLGRSRRAKFQARASMPSRSVAVTNGNSSAPKCAFPKAICAFSASQITLALANQINILSPIMLTDNCPVRIVGAERCRNLEARRLLGERLKCSAMGGPEAGGARNAKGAGNDRFTVSPG